MEENREQYSIEISDIVSHDFEQAVAGGLNDFNDAVTGISDRQPVAIMVCDNKGKPLGGMIGRSSLGLLFLDLFYLPAALRGKGLGSRLLARFEQIGRERGCQSAVLYTISFQAPAFYARHGWQNFGEIACSPPGTRRIFMSKAL